MTPEPLCVVTDTCLPVDEEYGWEATTISTAEELVRALHEFAKLTPRVLILRKPNGLLLFMGIEWPLAGAVVFPEPTSWGSWAAWPKLRGGMEDLWIPDGYGGMRFEAPSVMPLEDAIRIAVQVMQSGELPRDVDWVSPQGQRL